MRNAKTCTLTVSIGLLLGLAPGCGSGVGGAVTPDDVVYADNLTILTTGSALQLESLDATTMRFNFSGSDAGVAPGDILSGTSADSPDGGYLRRVESVVQSSGGVLIINTSQPIVDDAVEEGHFEYTILINPPPGTPFGKHQTVMQFGGEFGAGGALDISGELFDNGILTVSIPSGTIDISAEIVWEMDFNLFDDDEFFATFDGSVDLDFDVVVSASAPGYYQYDVELFALPPQPFGNLIIFGVVNVIFEAGIEVDASAPGTVETGLDAFADVELGGYYDSGGWSTSYDRSTDFNSHGWDWNLDGTVAARVFVRPKVEILFYSLAGPVFDLEPYLAFDADFDECYYDWDLTAGVSSHLGIDIGPLSLFIPVLPELELFDWHTTIASDQGSGCPTYLLTTSTEGCGSVSPSGGTYEDGTVVTLSASACSGSDFDHWEGDASGSSSTTSVVMTGNRHVVGVFNEIPPTQYTLTTSVQGCGNVSPSGGVFDEGTSVVVVADACDGWDFDYWEGNASGTNPTVTVTMNGDRDVVAVFEDTLDPAEDDDLEDYDLVVSVDGCGVVSPSGGIYEAGTIVQLTADPCDCWAFDHWEDDVSGSSATTIVTMNEDKVTQAVFTEDGCDGDEGSVVIVVEGTVCGNPIYLSNSDAGIMLLIDSSGNWGGLLIADGPVFDVEDEAAWETYANEYDIFAWIGFAMAAPTNPPPQAPLSVDLGGFFVGAQGVGLAAFGEGQGDGLVTVLDWEASYFELNFTFSVGEFGYIPGWPLDFESVDGACGEGLLAGTIQGTFEEYVCDDEFFYREECRSDNE